MKILVVVDMQNDFITGELGSEDAKAIVPRVVDKIKSFDGEVFFTQDTHYKDGYSKTREGKHLPVEHCIHGKTGWKICDEITPLIPSIVTGDHLVEKNTFGSMRLPQVIQYIDHNEGIEEIELVGLCTDICVISNAMILNAAFPNAQIVIDASCCAGVTKESHNNALNAMKSVHIKVVNEEV